MLFHSTLLKLGYLAALIPLMTIHLAFLASVIQGYSDWCNPYAADCISISKSGRHGVAYIIFKAGMFPGAILLGYFWQQCRNRLDALVNSRLSRFDLLGWMASISLLLYTLALGHSGEHFQLLRRSGVVLFMGLTFIVQVQIGNQLRKLAGYSRAGSKLLCFSVFILAVAIFSLVLDMWLGSAYDRLENAFEWWLVLLLICQLFFIARVFRLRQG